LNKALAIFSNGCQWTAVAILSCLPFAVATDFGGVLHWTQYVTGLVAIFAAALACTTLITDRGARSLRRHWLLLPLLLWLGYSYFQTIPFSPSFVSKLSDGSAAAYTDWIHPFLDPAEQLNSFPISVDANASRHAVAFLAIVILVVWASAMVFTTRARLIFLLSSISLGSTLIAVLGIWRLIDPNFSMWGMEAGANNGPFSTFVNRNNAALMLNFGFAAGLGLICWRLNALTGAEIDDQSFELSELISMFGDRYAMIGVVGMVFSGTGLLVCGSRGGIVAAIIGLLLAFGWVRQRRGIISLPVVGLVLAACVAILVVPSNLSLKSLQRMEVLFDDQGNSLVNDARWHHFPDGFRAARAYFPAGSGLSTYAYSHLPYQETGSYGWFKHADNLWLELLVEQGLVGVLLAIVTMVIIVRSLYFLARSPDPVDQGIRITGWYSIGAILASQAFDFGMIIPANLLLTACLFPAIIQRRVAAAVHFQDEEPTSLEVNIFQRPIHQVLAVLVCVFVFTAALPAINRLRKDAITEGIELAVKHKMETESNVPETLEELSQQLADRIETTPSATLLDWKYRVEHQRLRFQDVLAAKPRDEADVYDLFRQTSRQARRLSTGSDRQEPRRQPRGRIEERYGARYVPDADRQSLLDLNTQSLKLLPLGRDSRAEQISLEFLHRDHTRVQTAISQLQILYTGNSQALIALATMAMETESFDLAVDLFKSAISYRPSLVKQVLELTALVDGIDQTRVLPEVPTVHRQIAADLLLKWELQQTPELAALLQRVKSGLDCESCETRAQRAVCEERYADIARSQGEREEAIAAFSRAIEYSPTHFPSWKKKIDLMRSLGDITAARNEARKARILIPEREDVFNKIIEELAEQEVRGIDASKLRDATTIRP